MASEHRGRVFAGLLIILIGVAFLLSSLGYIDVGDLIADYWPLILVFIGLWQLLVHDFRNLLSGIILIIVGCVFMLMKWDILEYGAWKIIAGALIIFLGLWVLFRPRFRTRPGGFPEIKGDDLDAFALFSECKRRIESKAFRGGKATAVLGSVNLDFEDARLQGGKAGIELTTLLGSIEMRVPRDWNVEIDSNAILGSIEDKRKMRPSESMNATLFLKGTAVLGSIEITS
ncbi:MAG: hypothetical protein JXB23_11475 [Candidatus Aminicenantes bacterium]|nr:hypothetical protein [Candidatus Aminicenantes bacterium]